MGSPIAPLMADVCMNWVMDQATDIEPKPFIFFRYVDDLFCVFNCKSDLDIFFNKINLVHPNIQFTKEIEHHDQISYLYILITRVNHQIETTVYRKKTNTGLYINWSSLCPKKYKSI